MKKTFIVKNKKVYSLVMALSFGLSPLMTPLSLQATPAQEEAEHTLIGGIVTDLCAYGDQLKNTTETFFCLNGKGEDYTNAKIQEDAGSLLKKIKGIKTKCTEAQCQLTPHIKVMGLFKKLTTELSTFQEELKNAFQHLGNASRCQNEFLKLSANKTQRKAAVEKLNKDIAKVLPPAYKKQFLVFMKDIRIAFEASDKPGALESAKKRISTK